MKYVFIRECYDKKKKVVFNKSKIMDNLYVNEILIDSKWFDRIVMERNKNLLNNIFNFIRIKELKWRIKKSLKHNNYVIKDEDTDNNIKYVLSLELKKITKKKKMIYEILEKQELEEFKVPSEYVDNIDKYIESYMNKNKLLPSDIKALIFTNNINKIDVSKYQYYINKYKVIDFSTCVEINKNVLLKLEKINEEEGTTSHTILLNSKNIKEYNVNIFIDIEKYKYYKYKRKNNTLQIDTTAVETDVYNHSYLKVKEYINSERINNEIVKKLSELYGKITLSTIIANDLV